MTPVSIVITNYNRDRYLGEAIASVLAQTYADFELLIWDDGSTDESLAIARQFEQADERVRVIDAAHQGFTRSLRSAITQTQGPYLGWVDSDDRLAPTALAETLAVLAARPQVGMVYTDYQVIDHDGHRRGLGTRCQIPYSPERLLVQFMTFHFRLLRRSVYEQVGGIDATFERAQDYDLCLKFSEVMEIRHLPQPLYFYRQHADNVSHHDLEMLRWAHLASTQALQRRGLGNRYEIRVSSEFKLRLRSAGWPLVSIIIVGDGVTAEWERCLQSCWEQVYPNLEILVVAPQATEAIAQRLARYVQGSPRPLRVVESAPPETQAARQVGLQQARGDYIQWLAVEDHLTTDKILRQVKALEEQPNFDLAYSDWQWYFDEPGQLPPLSFTGPFANDWLLELLMDNWRPSSSYLLRRSVADKLQELLGSGGLMSVCTQREYFTRAALLGWVPLYVAGAVVIHHRGEATMELSSSPAYQARVENHQAMFQRFQQQAKQSAAINAVHSLLLNQSWELWEPAFDILKQDGQSCWLKHRENGEQVELRSSEARILQTWLKLPGAYTLEDQARRVVMQLWREVVLWVRQTQGLEAALDGQVVNRELAKVLELVPAVGEMCPSMTVESVSVEPEVAAMLKMPLYAPRFGKERLRVLMALERLKRKYP